ncbi:hypothetical protein P4O66_004901, partial [Electrophorus voltai]
YHCVIVCFLNQQPIHVLIGQDLILRAQLDLPAGDHITKVTWEHEAGKRASRRMKVGEYPSQGSGGRVGVNHNGALILQKFQTEDSGVYTITVTDQRGGQTSAHCTVEEYEAGRHVSVMVNVSHSSQEAWGTDPTFTWLHEKVSVTEALGRMSPDGSSLYLAGPLCGHFTCVVSNKLGHSSATYTAEPCERESGGTTVAVPHAPAICGWRYGLPAL